MAYFSENFTILVAKVETVPGTMETLGVSDFDFKVFNPTVSMTVEPDDESSKYANANHGEDVSIQGMQYGTITFSVKLSKSATITDAPTWAKAAYGCGAVPVTYAGTGWALQPLKEYDEKSLTIWIYKIQRGATPKATCFKFAGCMGKMTVSGEGTGKPIMLNFSFDGSLRDVDFDVANASIPDINGLDETCYERLLSSSVTIGGYERLVDAFSLDSGNEVSMVKDFSESTGILQYGITKRMPRLTVNPLMVGATGTVTTDYGYLYGSATGCPQTPEIVVTTQHWKLTAPKCQMLSCAPAGRDGLSSFDQNWKLLPNGYTGVVADAVLPFEATWELLQGARA